MKKLSFLIFILLSSFFFAGCTLQIGKSEKLGALQVSSLPKAAVYLDNKQVGNTPYLDEKLKPGELTLKLVPEIEGTNATSWSGKIKLNPETLTAVNWQFLDNGKYEGDILTLEQTNENNAQLLIISSPDGASVTLNSQSKGNTPLILKDLPEGEQKIVLEKEGYTARTVKAKTISKYRLTVNVELSQSETASSSTQISTASSSAEIKKQVVVVKQTDTGWLRVRVEPSLSASEAAKVNPGDEFSFTDEKDGWIKIEYTKGKFGWASADYLEKKAK